MKKFFYLFIVAIALSSCSSDSSEKFNLSLNLEEGQTYKQMMVSDINLNQSLMGQSMNIKMNLIAGMSYTVKAIENDEYQVEVKYDEMTMNFNTGQGDQSFSTKLDEQNNAMNDMMKKLTEGSFMMVMDKKGKVKDVSGFEKLYENMFDTSMGMSQLEIEQIKTQLNESFGEEAFKTNIETSFSFYPKSDVSVGEEWSVNSKMSGKFPADVKGKYTLKSITDDQYVISSTSTLEMKSEVPTGQIPVKMDLEGTMDSDMTVDRKTGWVSKATINQDFGGTLEMSGMGDEPMSIPIEVKNQLTLSDGNE